MLKKNVASQKWRVFAFDTTDGSAKTGDAANITGKIALDWAAAGGIADTNPTETEDGYYLFDLTQGETNADWLDIYPESATANIEVIGCPASMGTVAQYFSILGIESDGDLTKVNTLHGHTAQTADHAAELAKVPKSDSTVTWNATALASINAEADTALTDYDAPTKTEMDSAFTEIKGATWASGTDTLEHIRDKQTDIETDTGAIGVAGAGLTDLGGMSTGMKAEVNAEADTALTDYDAPTKTELDTAFTEIKGATWASGTDTLEHIRNKQTDIEADTNELQADDYPTLIAALPTAVENRTEMDSNSTQLAAIVADSNELQTDLTNGGRLDLLIDAILADSNEVQGDLTNGGRLDLLIDAILADSNELQADLTNGGRLDLLVDGIKAVTDALTVAAATKSGVSAGTMITGTVATGTLSTTQMTTDLAEATDNHYNDRLIIWTSGVLIGQVSSVTSYVGSGSVGLITHPASTEAPSNGDTFILL